MFINYILHNHNVPIGSNNIYFGNTLLKTNPRYVTDILIDGERKQNKVKEKKLF